MLTILEEGAGHDQVEQIFKDSLNNLFEAMEIQEDWHEHNAAIEMFPLTRFNKHNTEGNTLNQSSILSPTHETITRSRSSEQKQMVTPVHEHGKLAWKRLPREPLPMLPLPVDQWVGFELDHDKMPMKYLKDTMKYRTPWDTQPVGCST